jgi:hypothetical protein
MSEEGIVDDELMPGELMSEWWITYCTTTATDDADDGGLMMVVAAEIGFTFDRT